MEEVSLEIAFMYRFTNCPEGAPSETYLKCWEEVQTISCATLFAPVQRQEAVQAMSEFSCSEDSRSINKCRAFQF